MLKCNEHHLLSQHHIPASHAWQTSLIIFAITNNIHHLSITNNTNMTIFKTVHCPIISHNAPVTNSARPLSITQNARMMRHHSLPHHSKWKYTNNHHRLNIAQNGSKRSAAGDLSITHKASMSNTVHWLSTMTLTCAAFFILTAQSECCSLTAAFFSTKYASAVAGLSNQTTSPTDQTQPLFYVTTKMAPWLR